LKAIGLTWHLGAGELCLLGGKARWATADRGEVRLTLCAPPLGQPAWQLVQGGSGTVSLCAKVGRRHPDVPARKRKSVAVAGRRRARGFQ